MNKERYIEGIKQRDSFESDVLSIANSRIREYNELLEKAKSEGYEVQYYDRKHVVDYLKEIDEEDISGEYWDHCDYETTGFPASWIYDPDWKKPLVEKFQKKIEEKAEKKAEDDVKREEKELGYYLRLKEKYGGNEE